MKHRSLVGKVYLQRVVGAERLPWLVGLLLLESVSAYSLGRFQLMIDNHMTLALFCPMIVGTAGNAGNQPGVIFTRAVTTGEFDVGERRSAAAVSAARAHLGHDCRDDPVHRSAG
ncbi:unnamed protein product [Polarella glacialis]|uniref:Uncharacterized protein n=1 Tax=Polarella glacialis TaxID=89957 RepID=A0A813FAQ5_POLGL|nr:unnamed protein product [Polarella glacialis]